MLEKKFLKTKCKVTFELTAEQLPAGVEVSSVNVAGDFNDWNTAATPLKKDKKGTWKETVELELDKKFAYRYYVNGNQWYDDPSADEYAANDMGSQNCVVSTYK